MAGLGSGPQCHSNVLKCRVATSSLLNEFNTVCVQLQPLSNAAYENRFQSQKKNIRKYAPLCFQSHKKRPIARKERIRTPCLEDALKPSLDLEFISNGVTNIDNNHMPLEHYIGQFTAGEMVLFHHDIVPFCANARENDPRKGLAMQEFSVCAPKRNTVRVLHCSSSLHRETFVASFALSRLPHSLPSMKSKALTSKFRYEAVFCPSCRNCCLNGSSSWSPMID